MLVNYSNSPCCPEKVAPETRFFPASFLAASYFMAIILGVAGYAAVLKFGRLSGNAELLFSLGIWGINLLTLTVVSFLYFSEQEANLQKRFATLREGLLYCYMTTLWWPLTEALQISEWALVFGICAMISVLWLRFYCICKPTSVFKATLFLMTALTAHLGFTLVQSQIMLPGAALLFSALVLFAAFLSDRIPTNWLLKPDQKVIGEVLFTLSLLGNYGAIYWLIAP